MHLRPGRPQLGDQLEVTLTFEHVDDEIARRLPLCLGHTAHVLGRRRVDVDRVGRVGARDDLVHVEGCAREEHRSAFGDREHGDRVRLPERSEARALERIDSHVDLGTGSIAHPLAVVEHRRLVLLPLADHDHAVHRDCGQHSPHPVYGALVGRLLVAAANPARGADRARLGHADELERKVSIGRPPAHDSRTASSPGRFACISEIRPMRIRAAPSLSCAS